MLDINVVNKQGTTPMGCVIGTELTLKIDKLQTRGGGYWLLSCCCCSPPFPTLGILLCQREELEAVPVDVGRVHTLHVRTPLADAGPQPTLLWPQHQTPHREMAHAPASSSAPSSLPVTAVDDGLLSSGLQLSDWVVTGRLLGNHPRRGARGAPAPRLGVDITSHNHLTPHRNVGVGGRCRYNPGAQRFYHPSVSYRGFGRSRHPIGTPSGIHIVPTFRCVLWVGHWHMGVQGVFAAGTCSHLPVNAMHVLLGPESACTCMQYGMRICTIM